MLNCVLLVMSLKVCFFLLDGSMLTSRYLADLGPSNFQVSRRLVSVRLFLGWLPDIY